jgi:hypothetical protein
MKSIFSKFGGISLRFGKLSLNGLRLYMFLNILFVGAMAYVMLVSSVLGLGFSTMADVSKVPDSTGLNYILIGGIGFLLVAMYGFIILLLNKNFFKLKLGLLESLIIVFILMLIISIFQMAVFAVLMYGILLFLGLISYFYSKSLLDSNYNAPNKIWLILKVFPLSIFLVISFGMAPYSVSSLLPLKGRTSQEVSDKLDREVALNMARGLHRDAFALGVFAEGREDGDRLRREDFVKAFAEQEYLDSNKPIFDANKLTLSYKGIVYYLCKDQPSLDRCSLENSVS